MNDKNFQKINIKFEIRIQQFAPLPNFIQFGELQFLGPTKTIQGGVLGQTQPKNNLF